MMKAKFSYLIAAILFFIFIPSAVRSDEFRLVPSITAQEDYNSNIFLSSYARESDFVTILSPAFELVNRTEQSDAKLKIRLDHRDYADNRDLNATDQLYQGKFKYNLTPQFGFSADAGYIIDSSPERDLETTGLISSAIRRKRSNAALSTDYKVTEQSTFLLSYAYGKETYEKRYSDTLTHEVNAGLMGDLGKYVPALSGYVNIGYSNFDFSDMQMDVITGTMGASRDFSEIWSVRFDAGMSYTQSEFSASRLEQVAPNVFRVVTNEQTEDTWGWVGKASLNYKGEKESGELSYVRDIRPSSGDSNAAVRNALTLNTRYRINYEISVALNTGYFTNKSDQNNFMANIVDTRSYYISPRIRYDVSKDIYAEASYNYNNYHDNAVDTEAQRHLFTLRLFIQHPFLE